MRMALHNPLRMHFVFIDEWHEMLWWKDWWMCFVQVKECECLQWSTIWKCCWTGELVVDIQSNQKHFPQQYNLQLLNVRVFNCFSHIPLPWSYTSPHTPHLPPPSTSWCVCTRRQLSRLHGLTLVLTSDVCRNDMEWWWTWSASSAFTPSLIHNTPLAFQWSQWFMLGSASSHLHVWCVWYVHLTFMWK